jgi:ribosomal protein S18 acetylase RimI-like enzyme
MNNQNITPNQISIVEVDYTNAVQLDHLASLLNAYSMDDMGNGKILDHSVLDKLKADLPNIPGAYSFIAYVKSVDQLLPVGLVNCFSGYSTFKAAPLLNIHDIVVLDSVRGKGIGAMLIHAVEKKGRELGCCKITLEVRTDNPAEKLYRRLGFVDGDNPMIFLIKPI